MTNKAVWVTSFVVGLASGGELYRWIMQEDPTAPYRLHVFFLLLFLMVASFGTAIAHYLAIRFGGEADLFRSSRQGVEIGLFVALCAWLQLVQLLSPIVAVFVAGAFVSIELVWTNWRRADRPHPDRPPAEHGEAVT